MDIDLDTPLAALYLLHQKLIDELPDNLKNRRTIALWARDEIIRLHQKVSDMQQEISSLRQANADRIQSFGGEMY